MNTQTTKELKQQLPLAIPLQLSDTNVPLKGATKDIGKYEFSFQQKLGSGFTSQVYLGRNKQTKELVCVKIIDMLNFKNQNQKEFLENEIKCQQNLKSKYIVNILDIYKTNSFCFIVTQLCEDGDLFKLIKFSRGGLPQKLVTKFAFQLGQALQQLKNNQIIHRDIKSQNILLSKGSAKLADFGFSIQQKNLKQKEDFSLGSPLYMPLEALEQKKYGYESDIFSYGIVLYEMLHGQSPWQCTCQLELIKKMKNQEINFKTEINQKFQNLILKCLQRKPTQRLSIEEINKILKQLIQQKQDKNDQDL